MDFIQESTGESDLVTSVFETVRAAAVSEEGVVLVLPYAELFVVKW